MHFTFQLHQIFNKYFSISKDFWQNFIKRFIHKSSKIKKVVQTRKIYAQIFYKNLHPEVCYMFQIFFLNWRKKKQMNKDSMIMIKRNLVARVYLCRISFIRFDEDHDSIVATWSIRSKICVSIGATMPMWSCVN